MTALPRFISAPFTLLLFAVVMTVCGCAHPPMVGDAPARFLWQSGDQFVALVPAEQQSDAVPNDHPVSLDRERLGAALASLQWQEEADAKPVPLFTDYEISVLAEQIGSGLAGAGAGDDLVFALVGNHPAFMGLARRPQVTTGRVFYAKGRVQLILGMVHEELGKNDDRRLQPFVPGARGRVSRLSGTVIVPPGLGEKRRADWLAVNPAAAAPKMPPGVATPTIDAVPLASPEPEKAKPPTPAADAAAKRIEERLLLLNGLKDKGLITDEEYRAKRREILNAL